MGFQRILHWFACSWCSNLGLSLGRSDLQNNRMYYDLGLECLELSEQSIYPFRQSNGVQKMTLLRIVYDAAMLIFLGVSLAGEVQPYLRPHAFRRSFTFTKVRAL